MEVARRDAFWSHWPEQLRTLTPRIRTPEPDSLPPPASRTSCLGSARSPFLSAYARPLPPREGTADLRVNRLAVKSRHPPLCPLTFPRLCYRRSRRV